MAAVVVAHQMANATTSRGAVAEMLDEQGIPDTPEALLNPAAFTTDAPTIEQMLAEIDRKAAELVNPAPTYADDAFDRLVESIVQDAARAAEQVAVTVRPEIHHVRFVNLPCCFKCAVLAGRVYRWSSTFKRHPGCDCSMIPTVVASELRQNPEELVRSGQVRGLSKDDLRALSDGADLNRVVNSRLTDTSLLESGRALRRGNRLTPIGIYQIAGDDRDKALLLLQRHGYIT